MFFTAWCSCNLGILLVFEMRHPFCCRTWRRISKSLILHWFFSTVSNCQIDSNCVNTCYLGDMLPKAVYARLVTRTMKALAEPKDMSPSMELTEARTADFLWSKIRCWQPGLRIRLRANQCPEPEMPGTSRGTTSKQWFWLSCWSWTFRNRRLEKQFVNQMHEEVLKVIPSP